MIEVQRQQMKEEHWTCAKCLTLPCMTTWSPYGRKMDLLEWLLAG